MLLQHFLHHTIAAFMISLYQIAEDFEDKTKVAEQKAADEKLKKKNAIKMYKQQVNELADEKEEEKAKARDEYNALVTEYNELREMCDELEADIALGGGGNVEGADADADEINKLKGEIQERNTYIMQQNE